MAYYEMLHQRSKRNQMSLSCSNTQVALYGGLKKEEPDMRFGQ